MFEVIICLCLYCDGLGLVCIVSLVGLFVLCLIEDEVVKGCGIMIMLFVSVEVLIYLFNKKCFDFVEIEEYYGVCVEVLFEGENEGVKMCVGFLGLCNEFVLIFVFIVFEEEDDDFVIEDDYDEEEVEEVEVCNEGGDGCCNWCKCCCGGCNCDCD